MQYIEKMVNVASNENDVKPWIFYYFFYIGCYGRKHIINIKKIQIFFWCINYQPLCVAVEFMAHLCVSLKQTTASSILLRCTTTWRHNNWMAKNAGSKRVTDVDAAPLLFVFRSFFRHLITKKRAKRHRKNTEKKKTEP